MKRLLFLFMTLLVLGFGIAEAQDNSQIIVDTSQDLGEISPYVYGINHGPWSDVSLQMQEEAAVTGVTFFRFPAGHWGDQFDVTRPQVDLFMIQSRAWNVVPSIHVRLEGGSPEKAAELVRYTNVERDYNVRYWYIGNEPNLFDDYPLETFIADWREFAEAMLAVDPTIILIGPEISQFADSYESSYLDEMRHWLREFLAANGDLVGMVSVHRYPFPIDMGGTLTTIDMMRENVPRWATLVEILRTDIRDTLGRDLPIALTEVNSHWTNGGGGITTPDSYYNAVWWSGVLTTLIHSDIDMISYWNFSSVGANGAFGILDRYNPRPTYYTYQLYRDFGQTRLFSSSSDDYLTVLAARREDGAITVIITNLYEEAQTVDFDFQATGTSAAIEASILTPDLQAETVDPADYLDGTTLNLPAQSVLRLVFSVDS